MNFKNIYIHLLRNNNHHNYLATNSNLVSIPKREDFNDETSQRKIDELKDYFMNILLSNNFLTSSCLHDIKIQNEINMYLELLMNLSFNEEREILTEEEKKARSLIIYDKLKMYLKELALLEDETKYRIIALKELQKELLRKVKILHITNRKNCIKDEIDNLLGIILVLNNQKYAIYNKVNACQIEFKTIVGSDYEKNLSIIAYLKKTYKKLSEYARLLNVNINNINFNYIVNNIAYLEKSFEIYSYTHANDINDIRKTLKLYTEFVNAYWNSNRRIEEFTDEDLKILETKIRLFDEFAKNLITDEDLYNLYKLKFDFITKDIYFKNDKPLFLSVNDEERDYTEYSFYGQIIMEMIEDLILDKNKMLTFQFDIKNSNFWNAFKALLNPNVDNIQDGVYDANQILADNLVLGFLIAAHRFDLPNFFQKRKIKITSSNEFIVSRPLISNILYEYADFELQEEIPLETFIMVFNSIKDSKYTDAIFFERLLELLGMTVFDYFKSYSIRDLADLYPMIAEQAKKYVPYYTEQNRYCLPNGITIIKRRQSSDINNTPQSIIIKYLINLGQNKCIYTPLTLKKIDTNAFSGVSIEKLVLNEGCEELYVDTELEPNYVKCIVIPSTLKVKKYDDLDRVKKEKSRETVFGFDLYNINEIHFTYFKESIILNVKSNLKELFSNIIVVEEINNKKVFRCPIKKICLWPGCYNYGSLNCIEINIKHINDILTRLYGTKLYTQALNYYESNDIGNKTYNWKDILINLIVDKFIHIVEKKAEFILCNKNIKVIEKKM